MKLYMTNDHSHSFQAFLQSLCGWLPSTPGCAFPWSRINHSDILRLLARFHVDKQKLKKNVCFGFVSYQVLLNYNKLHKTISTLELLIIKSQIKKHIAMINPEPLPPYVPAGSRSHGQLHPMNAQGSCLAARSSCPLLEPKQNIMDQPTQSLW